MIELTVESLLIEIHLIAAVGWFCWKRVAPKTNKSTIIATTVSITAGRLAAVLCDFLRNVSYTEPSLGNWKFTLDNPPVGSTIKISPPIPVRIEWADSQGRVTASWLTAHFNLREWIMSPAAEQMGKRWKISASELDDLSGKAEKKRTEPQEWIWPGAILSLSARLVFLRKIDCRLANGLGLE